MRIKEILKTDSLAGSRIVLNSNFKNIKAEIADIDKFYEFDELYSTAFLHFSTTFTSSHSRILYSVLRASDQVRIGT